MSLEDKIVEVFGTEAIRVNGYIFKIIDDGIGIAINQNRDKYAHISYDGDVRELTMDKDEFEKAMKLYEVHKKTLFGLKAEKEFHDAMINHKEPLCPQCGKGRIVCPHGKIPRPHFFECTENCGWYAILDYKIDIT